MNAQTFLLYYDKTFGTNTQDNGVRIIYNGTNRMYLLGVTPANINGDKTEPNCDTTNHDDVWMLAVDTSLNIIWDKSIGGSYGEYVPFPVLLNNNTIIFSTRSQSDSSCEKSQNLWGMPGGYDYWVCAVDSNGNKEWDKSLGGTGPDNSPRIIKLTTGDFIVSGTSTSPISGDKTVANYGFPPSRDFWTIKLDSFGNKLWDKVYGGNGNENSFGEFTFSLLPTENGSFIISGSTQSDSSGDISHPSRGLNDIWIIKCDSAGNKIWDKRFGGSGQDDCKYVSRTKDNGYILAGGTNSPQDGDVSEPPVAPQNNDNCWIIKLDSLGNKQWDKRYGGNIGEGAWMAIQDFDGGYLIGANTSSDSGYHVSEPSYGGLDYWIFKIDSTGNKIWDKRFGSTGNDYLTSFFLMPDSSIVLCGHADSGTTAVKTDPGKGGNDYWIVRFKYVDNSVGINSTLYLDNQFTISPNPTNGLLILKSNFLGDASLIIYNLVGEKVYQQKLSLQKQNKLDFSFLKNSMYFLKIQNDKYSFVTKFVKD